MVAGLYSKSMFSFLRNCQRSCKVAALPYIPTGREREFLLLCILSVPGIVTVLYFGHSNRCIVVSHCSFNLHFLIDIECGAFFHMLYFPSVYLI